MPSIKDESTVEAIAKEYTSNGRCKGKALSNVGYSDAYALEGGRGCDVVFSNVQVKQAIARLDAKTAEKLDHDRAKAIQQLTDNIVTLDKIIANGSGLPLVQAVNARTAAIRELNAISNLHSSTVHTEVEPVRELSAADLAQLREMSLALTMKDVSGPRIAS